MANSKYEYVRAFEREEHLLPNTWLVVRIDGRGFHKLSSHYAFTKPNDLRALNLMNAAAKHTLRVITDITFAYGVSDEFSFVFSRETQLFERRREKLVSTVVSTFTAGYVFYWGECFGVREAGGEEEDDRGGDGNATPVNAVGGEEESKPPGQHLDPTFLPTFDARAILYPTTANLRDYLSWRQVDCHINNLYNTTFWALVLKGGTIERQAEERLKGTVAADKNEILFGMFGINYNNEGAMERKGSCVFRDYGWSDEVREDGGDGGQFAGEEAETGQGKEMSKTQKEKMRKARQKARLVVEHIDIIKDEFWEKRPWILGGKAVR